MLVLGTLAVFAVLVVIMIGVIIFDDYKANEIEDKETKAERDVSVMFLYVCMFVDIRSPLSTNYFMLIKLLLSEYCTLYTHTYLWQYSGTFQWGQDFVVERLFVHVGVDHQSQT